MKREYGINAYRTALPPTIDVVLFGLGPIGRMAGCLVAARRDLRLVGGVDIDPDVVGVPLSEVLEVEIQAEAPLVVSDIRRLPQGHSNAVAIQTTSSRLAWVASQMTALVEAGYHIVSSTEEATQAYLFSPELTEHLHRCACHAGRSIVGTGINPGFVMDLLPVLLSAPCSEVQHVSVERIVDASARRGPLQLKVGSGMTPEAFEELAEQNRIGHVGLMESLAFLAQNLDLPLERATESLQPVLAEDEITTEHATVRPGEVRGILHEAWGYAGDEERICLKLVMALDEPESYDRIRLRSVPPVEMTVRGGYHGDMATAGMLVNLLEPITRAASGWVSVTELVGIGCRRQRSIWQVSDSINQ